jgi:hypothetical protein
VVLFLALGIQGMTNTNIEDQRFYQAYAEHGDDLLRRYGTSGYFWVRLAFILPARLAYKFFGAVDGFFVWRYLLALVAIVPAYLLLSRLYGRAAGWIAVAAVLSNPVLIYAWGTDYPDSSAVSYLIAGTACLFMPVRGSRPRRGRIGWLILAGTAGALALHSQFVSAPLVAAAWLVAVALELKASRREAALTLAILLGCAAAGTGLLSLTAALMWGQPDIISPSVRAALWFRKAKEVRKFHSANDHWVLRNTYLVVPILAPALWAVLRWATPADRDEQPRRDRRCELGLAITAALQVAAFVYLQFPGKAEELEYHVYSSMLWSASVLLIALVVARLCRPLLTVARTCWLPAVLVVAVPYLLTFLRDHLHFRLLAGVGVGVTLLVVVWAGARRRPSLGLAAALTVLVVGATYAITTAEPPGQSWLAGQKRYPQPDFAHALRNNGAWHAQEDSYRLVAELNRTMPQATGRGQLLLTWYGPYDSLSSDLTTQYLWTPQSLSMDLPTLSALDRRILAARHPQTLVIFAPDPAQLAAAVQSLRAAGLAATVTLRETLQAGSLSDTVWVVGLGAQN